MGIRKYILTGGPCTGKTTMLEQLAKKFPVIEEASRELIEEQQKTDKLLPWTDLAKFEYLLLEKQIEFEKNIKDGTFLDRSLVDIIAFLEDGNIPVEDHVYQKIKNAKYTKVFFLEQLPFYKKDEARKEDPEKAKRLHEKIYEVYDRLGFDIVRVPFTSIKERLEIILKHLKDNKTYEIEGKFRANHEEAKKRLLNYFISDRKTYNEENIIYDFHGFLTKNKYLLRVRKVDGEYTLTIKGPNNGDTFNKRFEKEMQIDDKAYEILKKFTQEKVTYKKKREVYIPLGDSNCQICFDEVEDLGSFIEIEASENQIGLWKKRLGIGSNSIKQSYGELVK